MATARFAPELRSGQRARRFVEHELSPAMVGEETLFRAQLLATELVTNAVRHAGSSVELTLARRNGCIRIEARDDSTTRPATPRVQGETRHRGLLLVEDLSENWGVELRDREGKVVWCEVAVA